MIDWRILGASFAALIVISAVVIGGSGGQADVTGNAVAGGGIGDLFSGLIEKISGWFKGSPFGGFFSQPEARQSEVQFILYPQELRIKPDSSIDLVSNRTAIRGFSGQMTASFLNGTMLLEEKGSSMKIELPLDSIVIESIKVGSLSLQETGFEIVPNMTAQNGTLDISSFLGRMEFKAGSVEMSGNVSKIRAQIGGMNWELV